jgi:hypothetical protein
MVTGDIDCGAVVDLTVDERSRLEGSGGVSANTGMHWPVKTLKASMATGMRTNGETFRVELMATLRQYR